MAIRGHWGTLDVQPRGPQPWQLACRTCGKMEADIVLVSAQALPPSLQLDS